MLRSLLGATARFPVRIAAAGAAATTFAACAPPPPTENASWFSSDKYHIRYFDARGAAETTRMLLTLAGKQYTDDRWSLDFSKPRNAMSPGMAEARANGLLAANLDRAPVLVVNGKYEIGQSKSIERYLSKRFGLLGSNEIEAAQIDAFAEHIRDLKDQYNKAKGCASPRPPCAPMIHARPTSGSDAALHSRTRVSCGQELRTPKALSGVLSHCLQSRHVCSHTHRTLVLIAPEHKTRAAGRSARSPRRRR